MAQGMSVWHRECQYGTGDVSIAKGSVSMAQGMSVWHRGCQY